MQYAKLNVIQDYIGFVLLCLVIGSENSRHPLNQSEAKYNKTHLSHPHAIHFLAYYLVLDQDNDFFL